MFAQAHPTMINHLTSNPKVCPCSSVGQTDTSVMVFAHSILLKLTMKEKSGTAGPNSSELVLRGLRLEIKSRKGLSQMQ